MKQISLGEIEPRPPRSLAPTQPWNPSLNFQTTKPNTQTKNPSLNFQTTKPNTQTKLARFLTYTILQSNQNPRDIDMDINPLLVVRYSHLICTQ
jgi:hypothetical protein